jgi:Glu-tRNA(Gln) amidotransferase subunit E-like FAD-binding protein
MLLAQLCVFADTYMIKHLATYADDTITSMLHDTDLKEAKVSEILKLLEHVCQHDVETYNKDQKAKGLSITVTDYVAEVIDKLNEYEEFRLCLQKGGKVVSDIMDAVVRRKLA